MCIWSDIFLNSDIQSDIFMGVSIILLVLLSAFFSATETAFSFVNKIRIQHSVENGDKKAKKPDFIRFFTLLKSGSFFVSRRERHLSNPLSYNILFWDPVRIPPSPFGSIYLCNNNSTLYDIMYNITQ